MPIEYRGLVPRGVVRTALVGVVSDAELLAYYAELIADADVGSPPWRELVDGTGVTDMRLTPAGLSSLAALVSAHLELVRGGRVAMVAASEVTYGMFRMWEIQREDLGYVVKVFRRMDEAEAWIAEGLERENG